MAIIIELDRVEIKHDVNLVGTKKGNEATVYVKIKGNVFFELSFLISPYLNLNDAVETARQQLHRFAAELTQAAESPLS
jgi:hypothetical protein